MFFRIYSICVHSFSKHFLTISCFPGPEMGTRAEMVNLSRTLMCEWEAAGSQQDMGAGMFQAGETSGGIRLSNCGVAGRGEGLSSVRCLGHLVRGADTEMRAVGRRERFCACWTFLSLDLENHRE